MCFYLSYSSAPLCFIPELLLHSIVIFKEYISTRDSYGLREPKNPLGANNNYRCIHLGARKMTIANITAMIEQIYVILTICSNVPWFTHSFCCCCCAAAAVAAASAAVALFYTCRSF